MAGSNGVLVESQNREIQQIIGRDLGQDDWGSPINWVSYDSDTQALATLRNLGTGGHLVIGRSTDAASLLSVQDAGTTIRTLTVSNGIISSADLTLDGRLIMAAAAAKIVGGATSISIRDHTDATDNLLVTDAGAVTTRAGLTVSSGNLAVSSGTITASSTVQGTQLLATAGPGTPPLVVASTDQVANLNASFLEGHPASDFALVAGGYLDTSGTGQTKSGALTIQGTFTTEGNTVVGNAAGDTLTVNATPTFATQIVLSAASSTIRPGATSFAIRNNADSTNNLVVTDAGAVTVRDGLTVSAGGLNVTGTTTVGTLNAGTTTVSSLTTTGDIICDDLQTNGDLKLTNGSAAGITLGAASNGRLIIYLNGVPKNVPYYD